MVSDDMDIIKEAFRLQSENDRLRAELEVAREDAKLIPLLMAAGIVSHEQVATARRILSEAAETKVPEATND